MHTILAPVIRDDQDLQEALDRLHVLWGAESGTPAGDELQVLADLIAAYEQRHGPMSAINGIDLLRHLMDLHHLHQSQLPEIGSQGVVSEILSGKRSLNRRMAQALGSRFQLDPLAFLR
jgi:HTH-type transcriptional regulator/antitoxin HigA